MLSQVQSAFTRRHAHTPAVRAFLAEGNLRALHGGLQVRLSDTYRQYGEEAPTLAMDQSFVQGVEEFALQYIHDLNAELHELNSGFIRQYVEPLGAHLYRKKEFQSRIQDARKCNRPERFRRLYSSRVVDLPELPPTPQQYPTLSTAPRQTALVRHRLPSPPWANKTAEAEFIHPLGRGL